jgi:hypothetical protein
MFLVLTSTDHEHYRIGHIAAAVGDCYLIQFDKLNESADHPLPPMELYTVEELSEVCENCGQKLANLFKSRADMERWIAWLSEPEEPAVEGIFRKAAFEWTTGYGLYPRRAIEISAALWAGMILVYFWNSLAAGRGGSTAASIPLAAVSRGHADFRCGGISDIAAIAQKCR